MEDPTTTEMFNKALTDSWNTFWCDDLELKLWKQGMDEASIYKTKKKLHKILFSAKDEIEAYIYFHNID